MIWLNLKALEINLANYRVTSKNTLGYLLTILIIFTLLFYMPQDSTYPFTAWDLGEMLLVLLITIVSVRRIFSINQKGDNRDFLVRFLSLAFVIGLWVLIAVLLIWLAYKVIMFIIPLDYYVAIDRLMTHEATEFLVFPISILVFYYLMQRSFTRINSNTYRQS